MSHRKSSSSRALRDRIVGRRISGVIARPGRKGEPPMVMMLQFDDGGTVEFVSPRSDRLLREALRKTPARQSEYAGEAPPAQLALAAM